MTTEPCLWVIEYKDGDLWKPSNNSFLDKEAALFCLKHGMPTNKKFKVQYRIVKYTREPQG
jgi:hypothetical protein